MEEADVLLSCVSWLLTKIQQVDRPSSALSADATYRMDSHRRRGRNPPHAAHTRVRVVSRCFFGHPNVADGSEQHHTLHRTLLEEGFGWGSNTHAPLGGKDGCRLGDYKLLGGQLLLLRLRCCCEQINNLVLISRASLQRCSYTAAAVACCVTAGAAAARCYCTRGCAFRIMSHVRSLRQKRLQSSLTSGRYLREMQCAAR